MKTLYVMRHAKSDWTDERQDDFDRVLSNRGERAASLMGIFFAQKKLKVRGILSSTAQRAQQTAHRVMAQLPEVPSLVSLPDLYMASGDTMLERVQGLGDAPNRILIVGHNPSIQDFMELVLTEEALKTEAAQQAIMKFPTAGLAIFTFDVDHWSKVTEHSANLYRYITPKGLV